jgi:hypothetical protein
MEPNTTLICEYLYNFPEGAGTKKFTLPIFHTHPHSQTVMCGLAKNLRPGAQACLPAGRELGSGASETLILSIVLRGRGAKVIFRR